MAENEYDEKGTAIENLIRMMAISEEFPVFLEKDLPRRSWTVKALRMSSGYPPASIAVDRFGLRGEGSTR